MGWMAPVTAAITNLLHDGGHPHMRRHSIIFATFGALLLAPVWAFAQQAPAKIPQVGILSLADSDKTPIFDAFRQGLRELGWVEGRNITLEIRLARGDSSRGQQLAAELVALPVDVIVVEGFTSDAVAATNLFRSSPQR